MTNPDMQALSDAVVKAAMTFNDGLIQQDGFELAEACKALRNAHNPPVSDPVPDYTTMGTGDMLSTVGDDAKKWADAFMQFTSQYDHPVDHGDMIGWFANAIEHSNDIRWRSRSAGPADELTDADLAIPPITPTGMLEDRITALEAQVAENTAAMKRMGAEYGGEGSDYARRLVALEKMSDAFRAQNGLFDRIDALERNSARPDERVVPTDEALMDFRDAWSKETGGHFEWILYLRAALERFSAPAVIWTDDEISRLACDVRWGTIARAEYCETVNFARAILAGTKA